MASDKILISLAVDVGELKKRMASVERTQEHHSAALEQLLKSQAEFIKVLNQVQATTSSLASSVGLAMSELAISRALERRVDRLEAAVFPSKH